MSDAYGLIGVRRDPYNSRGLLRPFTVTHSVYSFVLLNVSSTIKLGVLYPPKPFWEDIDFNNLCEERCLVVLKCNRFYHVKKNLQNIMRCPNPNKPKVGSFHAVNIVQCPHVTGEADAGTDQIEQRFELRNDTKTFLHASDQIRQRLEKLAPNCQIMRLDATVTGSAGNSSVLILPLRSGVNHSEIDSEYQKIITVNAFLLYAVKPGDVIELAKSPVQEVPEQGSLEVLRCWLTSRGLDPDDPYVFTWPAEDNEAGPAYALQCAAREFTLKGLVESSDIIAARKECIVVLLTNRDLTDSLEILLERIGSPKVKSLIEGSNFPLERIFLVIPALLLVKRASVAQPLLFYLDRCMRRKWMWQLRGVWSSRQARDCSLTVWNDASSDIMADGCFILVLLERPDRVLKDAGFTNPGITCVECHPKLGYGFMIVFCRH